MGIERICAYCKLSTPADKYKDKNKPTESIEIDLNNIDDFVFYNKLMFHKECFYKSISHKRKKLTDAEIDTILYDSKKHIRKSIIGDKLFRFMLVNYDLTVINNRVFQKLSSIYSGTFRGMSVGIPVEDLFDMWQRKIMYLKKIANQNVTKGKNIDGNDRILYDLSVLINKYDSYLQWKREQQILESNSSINKSHPEYSERINLNIIEKQAKRQENNIVEDNIDTLLDEIF